MKFYFIYLLTFLILNNYSAQNTDSLKVQYYFSQHNSIKNINTDVAEHYLDSAIIISKKIDNKILMCKAYTRQAGFCADIPGKSAKALDCALNAIKIAEQLQKKYNDNTYLANAYFVLGAAYANNDKYKEARGAYQKAKYLYKDERDIADLEFNMGTLLFKVYQVKGAKAYLDSSILLIKNAYQKYLKYADTSLIVFVENTLTALLGEQGNYETAIEILKKSLPLLEKKRYYDDLIVNLNNIGTYYEHLKTFDSALVYYHRAVKISEKYNNTNYLMAIYLGLAGVYDKIGDYKNAYYYARAESQIKDSVFNIEKIKATEEMSTKYQTEIKEKENQYLKQKYAQQRTINWLIFTISIILLGLAIFVYRNLKIRNKLYNILKANKEIIEKRNTEIIDSIHYAKRIQTFLMSSENELQKYFKKYFLIYYPKDIVSGDFYFVLPHNNYVYIGVFDCTGHGVPGAFMSVLNITLLNEAIKVHQIKDTGAIFDYIRNELTFKFSQFNVYDGMDGILFRFEKNIEATKEQHVQYSAANLFPVLKTEEEIFKLDYDKMPIGWSHDTEKFKTYHLNIERNSILILSTDGFKDQFGGEKNKRLGNKNFLEVVKNKILNQPEKSKVELSDFFEKWKDKNEQTDDVTLLALYI